MALAISAIFAVSAMTPTVCSLFRGFSNPLLAVYACYAAAAYIVLICRKAWGSIVS
jgi:hypothetical protein